MEKLSTGFAGSTTRSLEGLTKEVEARVARMSAQSPGTTTVAVCAPGYLLMGQRRDNGKWTVPGGGMNPGELPLAGAIRELREEAGIEAASLASLGAETVSGRSGRSVTVHCFKLTYAARVATQTVQDPDQEVSAWQWIPVHAGLSPEIKDNLQSPRNILLIKMGLL